MATASYLAKSVTDLGAGRRRRPARRAAAKVRARGPAPQAQDPRGPRGQPLAAEGPPARAARRRGPRLRRLLPRRPAGPRAGAAPRPRAVLGPHRRLRLLRPGV